MHSLQTGNDRYRYHLIVEREFGGSLQLFLTLFVNDNHSQLQCCEELEQHSVES